MSINYPNTEPLVEDVLKNFFTEADADEFNSNYLAAEQPQDVSDEKLKEKFDVDLESTRDVSPGCEGDVSRPDLTDI